MCPVAVPVVMMEVLDLLGPRPHVLSRAGTVLSTVPRLEEWSRGQQGEDAGSPEPSPQSEGSPQ